MLSHVRIGSGPPLLLAHPFGTSHRAFTGVAERLAGDFEVFAVDLPGFGDSAPVAGAPSLRALADACAALMAAHGHQRFHVAGNSMGGGLALHLALDGRALSACALSPIGFLEGWERAYLALSLWSYRALGPAIPVLLRGPGRFGPVRRALVRQTAEHGDRRSVEELVDTFERLMRAPGYWRTSRAAVTWRCPTVPSLPIPVTVAWAAHDRLLLTGSQSARARERLPAARHVTLAGCGHVPMWDDPGLVADTIREAVRD